MATILEFRRVCGRASSDGEEHAHIRSEQGPAEIVIFPGIRIERHQSDDHEPVDEPSSCEARGEK